MTQQHEVDINQDSHYSVNSDGLFVPRTPVHHRDTEYDSASFDALHEMQRRHFWYAGRNRFLLRALKSEVALAPRGVSGLSVVDLGGGCGGWVQYLRDRMSRAVGELALADSSLRALELAGLVISHDVKRYQIDLLHTGWHDRWDVAFLLDVLEHIPHDEGVLTEAFRILRPGGLLFVTTPALKRFWSHNDKIAHHVRRYSRADLRRLGAGAGFEVRSTRYFMFFLSPLLLASRLKKIDVARMTPQEVARYVARTHRVPAAPVNRVLAAVFAMETPIGHWIHFPWGTSVLGIFRKPL
jgi:2-polyprenyl-3-methyl-5-hydroxy-6-metoxy-1,4-benzoquinol methylase